MTTRKVRGTIRKMSIEGGVWALVSDAGETIELLGAPTELASNGLRVEVDLDARGADASIGMVGSSARVRSWRKI